MITREFNLNLNAGRSTPLVIFANQFNSDEQWVFTLFDDNGQQYIPSSGSIVGIKADGLGIINSATVTAGKVVVDVTEQITACAGISEFELSLDNGTHGTANFKVVVEKKPSEGAEYSDSDISLIQEALDIVDTLPTGGTAGQVLTKTTNGSSWQDAQAGLPSGGTTGQVLTKTASGSAWQNAEKELPTGGSAGQVLTKTASGTTWSSVDAFPSEGTTGQVLTKATDGVAWTDAGNPTDAQVATAVSDWLDENITPTTPAVDATLTITGAAADAKKTGDEISALKSEISDIEEQIEGGTGDGLTDDIKEALLQFAQKVAYIDANGQTYYDDLYDALYPPIRATKVTLSDNSISFTSLGNTHQLTATVVPSNTTDVLVWSTSDESVATVSDEGLVTSVAYGTAVITATAGNVSASCSVTIAQVVVTNLVANYSQTGTVYATDALDSLKDDLVVTATYNTGTSETVSTYSLTGVLAVGTSAITVSYGGETTTFNVTVSDPATQPLPEGYTRYDYVRNKSSQAYLKTGLGGDYANSVNHEIGIKFSVPNITANSASSPLYCLRQDKSGSNNSRAIWVQGVANTNNIAFHLSNTDSGFIYTLAGGTIYEAVTSNKKVYIDGVEVATALGEENTVTKGILTLYGQSSAGTYTTAKTVYRIYSFWAKDSEGKYEAYFIPCTNSEGTSGFYDPVRSTFYSGSSATGLVAENE